MKLTKTAAELTAILRAPRKVGAKVLQLIPTKNADKLVAMASPTDPTTSGLTPELVAKFEIDAQGHGLTESLGFPIAPVAAILSKLEAEDKVAFSRPKKALLVTFPGGRLTLPVLELDLRHSPKAKDGSSLIIGAGVLREALRRTVPAMGKEEDGRNLNWIAVEPSPSLVNQVSLTASNAYSLHTATVPGTLVMAKGVTRLPLNAAFLGLLEGVQPEEELELHWGNTLTVSAGGLDLQLALPIGVPAASANLLTKLITRTYATEIVAPQPEWKDLLALLQTAAKDDGRTIELTGTDSTAIFSCGAGDVGLTLTKEAGKSNGFVITKMMAGKRLVISLPALKEAVEASQPEATVRLRLGAPTEPVVVDDGSDMNYAAVVMPRLAAAVAPQAEDGLEQAA